MNQEFAKGLADDIKKATTLPEVLGYRVLLDMTWRMENSKVLLPDTASVKENEGIVVALGNGRHNYTEQRYSFDVNVGDHVLVSSYGGVDFEFNGRAFRIVSGEDLVAVLERNVTVQAPENQKRDSLPEIDDYRPPV